MDRPKYVPRDNKTWNVDPPVHRKILKHNVYTITKSGPTKCTKNLDVHEVFQQLITEDMVYIIVRESNRKGYQLHINNFIPFTKNEIYAFIGIVLYAGVTRSNRENITELWAQESHPIYRATMARNRFTLLLKCIRFEQYQSRETKRSQITRLSVVICNFKRTSKDLLRSWNKFDCGREIIPVSWWHSLYAVHSMEASKVRYQSVVGERCRDLLSLPRPDLVVKGLCKSSGVVNGNIETTTFNA